ncbi:MAG: diguanylate cyclase [Peptococcaceae bacterium]|nr:diguanylate cyclase [Peptococcaceae bacterium]
MNHRDLAHTILNCINELVFVRDLDKNILFMNKRAEQVTGWAASEALKIKKCYQVFGDSGEPCRNCRCDSFIETGGGDNRFEKIIINPGKEKFHFRGSVFPLLAKGSVSGFIVVMEDRPDMPQKPGSQQAEQRKIKKALLESEEKYRQLAETIEDGFYEVDLAGNLLYYNDALARIYGMKNGNTVKGASYRDFMDEKNSEAVYRAFNRVFNTGRPEKGFSLEIKRPDGAVRTLEVSISLMRDAKGKPYGFRGIIRDITERRQAEERLKYLSMHDIMTGLYNRTYFEEEMARLNGGRFSPVTIICCDVDGLKLVNDTFGHKKGDELLKTVAEILKSPFRSSDVVARVGGDEFAVILPRTDEEAARRTCERINQAVENHNLKGTDIPISLSVGMATGIISGDLNCDELYRRADNDMYQRKMQNKASSRGAAVRSLIKALEDKDFLATGHAHKTFQYANQLGSAAGLSKRELNDLKLMAQFHDIGKVGITESILFKREPLDQKEWEEIKRHSEMGYRIARSTPELSSIADWILYHHEWWNGEGYPLGLKDQEIPLLCRVFSIAEAFDVMTSGRPYRTAVGRNEALRELERCSATQFDPDLVNLFTNIIKP